MAGNPIKVCVEKHLPDSLKDAAKEKAIEVNPRNRVEAPGPKPLTGEVAKLWNPGRTLKVRFVEGDPNIHQKVERWAHEWSNFANIRFDFGSHADAEIRIAFQDDGSWSYVGTDALLIPAGQQTMNYGWLTPTTPDDEYSRVVIHEFGHALGMHHEHQNPGGGIKWNKEVVYRYYAERGWTREMVDNNLFRKLNANQMAFTPLDANSIMMYPIQPEFTVDGFSVGWNRELSPTDKDFIGQLYP